MSRDNPYPCPVCHRRWRYLAAHLWAAHGERVVAADLWALLEADPTFSEAMEEGIAQIKAGQSITLREWLSPLIALALLALGGAS